MPAGEGAVAVPVSGAAGLVEVLERVLADGGRPLVVLDFDNTLVAKFGPDREQRPHSAELQLVLARLSAAGAQSWLMTARQSADSLNEMAAVLARTGLAPLFGLPGETLETERVEPDDGDSFVVGVGAARVVGAGVYNKGTALRWLAAATVPGGVRAAAGGGGGVFFFDDNPYNAAEVAAVGLGDGAAAVASHWVDLYDEWVADVGLGAEHDAVRWDDDDQDCAYLPHFGTRLKKGGPTIWELVGLTAELAAERLAAIKAADARRSGGAT